MGELVAPARVKGGRVVHRAIDMGGYMYIACHADPTTMRTEICKGEVTCKRCLSLKQMMNPRFEFADEFQALKHPFCRDETEEDGMGAGYHDGINNLKVYLPKGMNDPFKKGYQDAYYQAQQTYTYNYQKGHVKEKPQIKVPIQNFSSSLRPTQSTPPQKERITLFSWLKKALGSK
jgi:hypothetical protein